uniref:Uncharacterized protein n=1 Tax=Amphiprion percula TaxID=161767 RepID=A0A3P8RYS0_AMPPE
MQTTLCLNSILAGGFLVSSMPLLHMEQITPGSVSWTHNVLTAHFSLHYMRLSHRCTEQKEKRVNAVKPNTEEERLQWH